MIKPEEVHSILSRHILADGYDFVLDLEKSKGSWLYDSLHDKKLLDFFGFFATSTIGMNHDKMFEPSFLKKLQRASINKPTNSDVYTVEMAEFVDALDKIAAPPHMKHYFFIEGGALAVENALKTAIDWKVRKNFLKGNKEEKGQKIMHLKEAFHGRSGYTLSLTNTFDPNKIKYFPKFNWPRITNPKITFPLNEENLRKVEELENKSLKEAEEFARKDKDDIAALIIEPIQAEGGDNHFRKEYFQRLRKFTDDNDMLLIVDEVQTGMGITGKWWAYQHFDFNPDILVFGKKLQVCGIMVNNRIEDIEEHVFHVPSRINSTWGGNLADMVRATRYLEIIKEDNLVENAEIRGRELLKGIQDLQDRYPEKIYNARGRGLMVAFDLKDTAERDRFIDKLYRENNMLAIKAGEKGIRFRPSLAIEKDEISEALNRLEKTVKSI
jgi:L-lysine 6-transaminase precursor (EC 2.6.1.36)